MLNFAVIKDGKVDNIIVADSAEIAEQVTGYTCVPDDGTAQIGFTWDGSIFEEPTPVVAEETPAETPTAE
jgi:hypothetical protein